MHEHSANSLRRLGRWCVAPALTAAVLGAMALLYYVWGIKIPQAAVVAVMLMVMVSLLADISGAIVCNILSLAGILWYYKYVQNSIGAGGTSLARMIIIVIALPAVTTIVLTVRRRLVKALAAPAQAERSLFQAVMASMHDAIVETDWKGIRDVNASFCKMTGFTREELIGAKAPFPFWPIEQYAAIASAMETSMRGQALDFELVLTRKDGERFPVLLSVSRILDSSASPNAAGKGAAPAAKTSRVLYSFRDITDLKRVQDRLQQQSRELEAAKEVAEIANRTKDRFLNLLSHELRSPLTPILTLASVLEHDSRLPAELRHDMETIRRNAEMEGRLMDELLELVRVAKGSLPPDVDSSVRGVAQNVAAEGAGETEQSQGGERDQSIDGQPRSAKQLKILIVEDHQDTSRVLSRILSSRGHTVTTASTMQAGLDAALHQEFDFLISDIGLPDGSGLDLMRRIRQVRPIRAIALSGFGNDDDVQKSRDAGFLEHLTKPVNFRVLDETIERLASGTPASSPDNLSPDSP